MSTLLQILYGVILNAWKAECRYPSLADFASSNPSPNELVEIAERIIDNYASVAHHPNPRTKPKNSTDLGVTSGVTEGGVAHRNICLLTWDLLYVLELTEAIPSGDFGRIEDILGRLAMIFRGAGSNNYSSEVLHWIYNIKNIWTPKFV